MNTICCSFPPPNVEDDEWKHHHLESLQKQLVYPDISSTWARLICTWNEKKENGEIFSHKFAACIDTLEWGIYLDCTKRKIYSKCLFQLLARPIHMTFKTLYHLSLAPIFYEIAQTWAGYQTKKDCLKNSLHSLADIIRTPLYGLALIVTSIAILIIAPFNPDGLYNGRTLLGKIEQMANWNKSHTPLTLASCFQPFPLSSLYDFEMKDRSYDTIYSGEDPFERQIINFSRSVLRHKRRQNFEIFDCTYFPSNKPYISPFIRK